MKKKFLKKANNLDEAFYENLSFINTPTGCLTLILAIGVAAILALIITYLLDLIIK